MITEKRYRRICQQMGINPETVSPTQLKAIAATKGCGIAMLWAAMECSDALEFEDYSAAVTALQSRKHPNQPRSKSKIK